MPILALLVGCSSDATDPVELQNLMPLTPGSQLNYTIRITTFFGDEAWVTNGNLARRVLAPRQVTVGGETFFAIPVEDDFPELPAPPLALADVDPVKRYVEFLFDPDGGLADWTGYFRQQDANGDGRIDRITRVASGPAGGAYTEVPQARPHLLLPFQVGYAANNSYPLTTIPMYTNNPTLGNSQTLFNSQYRQPIPIAGERREYTTATQNVGAEINFEGYDGPFTGVTKTDLAEDLGPSKKDIDLELRIGGRWVRFHIFIGNVSL
jgi:hypothetical protein